MSGFVLRQPFNKLWTKLPKRNGITVMGLMPINGSGITLAGMRFRKAKQTPTRWKQIMLNCVTTWLGWFVNLAAFLVVRMLWSVPCVYLFFASIAGNFISNVFLVMPLM